MNVKQNIIIKVLIALLVTCSCSFAVVLDTIQRETVKISTDFLDVTVSKFDSSKTVLFYSHSASTNSPSLFWVIGEVVSSTRLRFTRSNSDTSRPVYVHYQLVTFSEGVSVQRGRTTKSGSEINIPIKSVDISKSWPIVGSAKNGNVFQADDWIYPEINSPTNLRVAGNQTNGATQIVWQVVTMDSVTVRMQKTKMKTNDLSVFQNVPAFSAEQKTWFFFYQNLLPVDKNQKIFPSQLPRARINGTQVGYHRAKGNLEMELLGYFIEFRDQTYISTKNFGYPSEFDSTKSPSFKQHIQSSIVLSTGPSFSQSSNEYDKTDDFGTSYIYSALEQVGSSDSSKVKYNRTTKDVLSGGNLDHSIITFPKSVTTTTSIKSGKDDLYIDESDIVINGNAFIKFGGIGSGTTAAIQFKSIPLKKGAIVLNAFLQFSSANTASDNNELNLGIGAEYPKSTGFTNQDNQSKAILEKTLTKTISWSIPPWNLGEKGVQQKTPDLSSIIQTLINHPSWTGDSILFVFKRESGIGTRYAKTFEGGLSAELSFSVLLSSDTIKPTLIGYPRGDVLHATLGKEFPFQALMVTGSPATLFAIKPSLPAGLKFDSTIGSISGTPSIPSSIRTYSVIASNNRGADTLKFNLEVINENQSPAGGYTEINTLPATSITHTEDGLGTVRIPVRLFDPDGDSLRLTNFAYSVNSGASWVTISDTSNVLPEQFRKKFSCPVSTFSNALSLALVITTNRPEFVGIYNRLQSNIRFRFQVSDGKVLSNQISTTNFFLDNEFPAVTFLPLRTSSHEPDLVGQVDEKVKSVKIVVDHAVSVMAEFDPINYRFSTSNSQLWLEPLSAGSHHIRLEALDFWGNLGVYEFPAGLIIDTNVLLIQIDKKYTNDQNPVITGQVANYNAIVYVSINGKTVAATVNVSNGSWSTPKWPEKLQEGTYSISATAQANALIGNDITDDELVVDLTPPEVSVVYRITNQSKPDISGFSSEPVNLSIQIGSYVSALHVDSSYWTIRGDSLPLLFEGVYDLKIKAVDRAGNLFVDDKMGELTIDQTSPRIVFTQPQSKSISVLKPNFRITFSEPVYVGNGDLYIRKSPGMETIYRTSIIDALIDGSITGLGESDIVFNLKQELDTNQKYFVQIDTNAFKDLAGNSFQGIKDTSWSFTTLGNGQPFALTPTVTPNGIAKLGDTIAISIPFSDSVQLDGGNLWMEFETGTVDSRIKVSSLSVDTSYTDVLKIRYVVRNGDYTNKFDIRKIELDPNASIHTRSQKELVWQGLSIYSASSNKLAIDGIPPSLDMITPLAGTVSYFPRVSYRLSENLKKMTMTWKPDSVLASTKVRILDSSEINLGMHSNVPLRDSLVKGIKYKIEFELYDLAGNQSVITIPDVRIGIKLSAIKIKPDFIMHTLLNDTVSFEAVGIDSVSQGGLYQEVEVALPNITWKSIGFISVDNLGVAVPLGIGRQKIISHFEQLYDTAYVYTEQADLKIPQGGGDNIKLGTQVEYDIPEIRGMNLRVFSVKAVPDSQLPPGIKVVNTAITHDSIQFDSEITIKFFIDTSFLGKKMSAKVSLYQKKSKGWEWLPATRTLDYLSINTKVLGTYVVGIDEQVPVIDRLKIDSSNINQKKMSFFYKILDNISNPATSLHILRGGLSDTSLQISSADSIYRFNDSLFMNTGISIWVEADDHTNTSTTSAVELVRTLSDTIPSPAKFRANKYQLLAFPYDLSGATIRDLLYDDFDVPDREKWRLYDYKLSFQEIRGNFPLVTGRSYWLNQREPNSVDLNSPYIKTVPLLSDISIELSAGWNCLSNPYPFAVPFYSVYKANLDKSEELDIYQIDSVGKWISADALDSLRPWQGIVLWNGETSSPIRERLVIPSYISWRDTNSIKSASVAKKSSSANQSWLLWIEQNTNIDGVIQIGTGFAKPKHKPRFELGRDPISLAITRDSNQYLMTDLRSHVTDGASWKLKIKTLENAQVKVKKSFVQGTFPNNWGIWLVSKYGKVDSLTNNFVYTPSQDSSEYLLVTGTPDYLAKVSSDYTIPFQIFSLNSIYPNPFRNSTQIKFQLPTTLNAKNQTDPVTIDIYNIRGEKVYTWSLLNTKAGWYQHNWNGRENSGNAMPAGAYYVRLTFGQLSQTKLVVKLPG